MVAADGIPSAGPAKAVIASAADMTKTTADAITAFAGPALGIPSVATMPQVLAKHASLHTERLIAATGV